MILSTIRKFAINYHLGILLACSFLLFSCAKDRIVAKGQQSPQTLEDQAAVHSKNRPSSFSDEDIFRGIMFMSGDAANAIPEIKEQVLLIKNLNPTEESRSTLKKMQDDFIRQVELQNPGYISAFVASIRSHDHVRIEEELKRAEDVVFTAVSKYFKFEIGAASSAKEEVLNIFISKQAEVEDLLTQFQLGEISKTFFESSIMSTLQLDHSKIKALAETVDPSEAALFGGCVAFLSFLACNAAVAINIAGYINVALAAAVAIAIAAWLAVYKKTWNNPKNQTLSRLDYENYINSLATKF